MDPNQQTPLNSNVPPAPQQDLKDKMSQASGEFIHNHYESWLRKLVNWTIGLIKFIQYVIMQVIDQIFSK